MKNIKVRAHTAYLGNTGYSSHARGFFRELSKYVDLRVRNFNWDSSDNIKKYITQSDLDILDQITLSVGEGVREDFPISQVTEFQSFDWKNKSDKFDQDVDIVLIEPSHFYFYEEYKAKIKIAYTVWESTQVSDQFLTILTKFDAIWVVSQWHKDCLVRQGVEISKIYVVPEGVDLEFNVNNNYPPLDEYVDNRFKFLFFGRWDYRKSVPEIVKSFLDEFRSDEEVDLILSADNPFSIDGMRSTEERLQHYGLDDDRIKVKHFPSREEYVNYLHNGHVMITCARSEGWNIPLCESLAAGIPVTYSNWGAQLEFCKGIGNPVNVIEEIPASDGVGSTFRNGYDFPGNYCLPDYKHLGEVLRYIYQNYDSEKKKSAEYSKIIRDKFSWDNIGQIGFSALNSTIESCHKIGVVFSSQNEFRRILEKFNKTDTLLITNGEVEYDLSNFMVYSNQIKEEDKLETGINTSRNLGYSKICFSLSDQQFEFDLNMDNQSIINLYQNKKNEIERTNFIVNFIDGPRVEILSNKHGRYHVEFIDSDKNQLIYESTIFNNCWCSSNYQYFINWLIRITDVDTNQVVYTHQFSLDHKKTFICMESSSLGDCIAWIPGVDEFRKKHNCRVVLSTFRNDLFRDEYPEIEFVDPGSVVDGLYSLYRIGWYYTGSGIDTNRNPVDPKTRPMQATSFDILGVDYQQIRSKIKVDESVSRFEGPYVCIGTHATAQAKYWNNPTGWQELIDWFNSIGYKVVMISREGGEYMGNKLLTGIIDKTGDLSIEDRIIDLKHSKMFIGIGSGLSWLAWAVGIPVTLISGFSSPETEFLGDDVIRIFNPDSCNSCFNRHMLDAGDWMWCPDHKNTERQFECTKSITGDMVISRIKEYLDKL